MNDNNLKDTSPFAALKETISECEASIETIDEIIEVIKDHREYKKMKLNMALEGMSNIFLGEENDK